MPDPFRQSKRLAFDPRDISATRSGRRSKFSIGSLKLESMTVKELAFWAISSPSDRHRMACVCCLLDRLDHGHDVFDILKYLNAKDEQ